MPDGSHFAIDCYDRLGPRLSNRDDAAWSTRCVEISLCAGHRVDVIHGKIQIPSPLSDLINNRMAVSSEPFRSQESSSQNLRYYLIPTVSRQRFA